MQDTIQRGKDWLEGNVANPVGMQIQLGDGRIATIEAMHEDGKSAIATLPDGTQFMVPKDVLQRIVNNGQYADYKARRDAEASKREAEQGTESAPETVTEGGQPLPEEASTKEEESREYAQGDVFDVVVDGQKMHAEIVSPKDADGRFVVNVDDGESMRTLYVTPEELAAMEYREEPSTKAEETRLATEGSSEKALERGEQPTEEHTPTALERIPRDEKGNAQFHDVDTETAWDGLVEMSGNEETAHRVAEASLANAERKLKAAKALKEKGETPEELLRSIRENEAAVAEAQRVVDAWKAIVGEKARREEAAKAEAERIATEKAEAERKAAEERERAEAEEEARVEAERKAEEERKTKEEERKERDENGQPFVVSSDGTTTFGEITEDTGLTAAPIKLSEGVADKKGNGYGLRHIEARHGDQIRKAGFSSVEEFVKYVASNYDKHNIKIGKKRANGVETYLIQAEDEHSNMLYVELSKDGSYWNVNSGGIFRKGYAEKKKDVGQNTEHPTSATTLQDKSFVQTDKDNGSQSADTHSDKQHPSADKGTTLPADQQTSDEENTKKVADSEGENTLKAKIEAASADVNTEPTEAQKKAGNYKKGHVQVGTFDITIEQPEGSIRRGTDANGKQWEIKMHNTYGYFRGTEGVDGDHIDVFLSNDIDGWNGRKVFVVDQYNPDGTFDEHKVMLGFNDMDEAKSDYLANYEKGWENGRRITVSTTNLEDFEKWIDSSHRKTKPFSEYSSVNKGSEKAEKKQKKQSVFDKAKEIADKEEKKRKAEAEDDSVLGQATRAVGKKKKVNRFKYTASEKNSNLTLRGVHYANGYAYASDGYILFKEKADYPKEWEGTTRDKDGNLIDGKYPDTEKAIHRLVHIPDKEVESLPSKEVLDFAIAASKKLKGEAIPVAIDGIFFNAVNLKKFLEAVASKGMDKVVYRHPMLYATNGKDEIVMMPTVNTLEGALDIADKMESAGLPKEQIDAWKAHIEAADKKKSFDDFKKAVENAKKEGVRPTEADKQESKAEADKTKQKPLTEAERKDAEEVAGALGYRVEWVDTMEENGTIDADKKVIRIAKDAENPLVQVLGHEVAHGVKRMDGGKFKALQKAAMEVAGEKEWNERIEKKRKLNAYAEGKLAEEVTCDIVGEALNDKDALKRLAESLRGEKGILARLRDAVARMVEYFKNRGDKEGVRRMKAADKLLAEFESALKEGVAPEQVKPEDVDRSVRESRSEKTELTEEERELRDNLVERMRKGGLDVVTDSEEMQRVIDTENERTRDSRGKKSEAARKRDEALYAVDWSTAFVSGKSREEATEIRRERGRKFKEETKELYGRVLSGNFDDVTLRLIDKFVDKSTPNNPYERPISKRLPTRALQKMRGGERTGSIDALFSRISESAVGKDGKALPRAERERAIEEKKKELLKKWAIATGNWHTDVSDFSDGKEPIGSGTDSDVYLSKDGKSVIKVSKGKPYGKRFRPDVDNVALFNTVFPGSRYTIEGYGEIDGKFVRFLEQPIVDFTNSTPLTEGERVAYMEKLGFKPINKENTAFSNGEIIASDLQKSNIVKDEQGNIRVIDADMKLHTKDFGGKFSYPDAETDTRTDGMQRFLRTADGEVYGLVKDGRIYLDPKVATSETAVHEYTHLWGDMLRRKDSEQWSHTVKELKNSVLWEEVKELYPELKTDDEIADEVLSTFSGRRGAERLREEARRVADGEGGVFTKAKAIETLERVKEAIARFWEGVARMFGINRYRSAEELADMAMRDLINGVKPTSRTFTFDNFYKDTKAVFEGTERPKGKPDYTSYSGSEYWYGEDKGGKYVVRGSDHWSGEFKVKDGERTNVGRNHYSEITEDGMLPIGAQGSLKFGWEKGLSKPVGSGISAAIDRRGSGDSNNIASCYWYIDNAKEKDNKGFTYGKAYLSEFEDKERRRDIPGDDWHDIQGLEGGTRAMAERIAEQPVEEINNRFNEELEKYQNNELPKGHRFELGMPSAELQSAGFPTLPISMRSSLLAKKAGAERHPFAPTDLRDLVNAIQKPIAIFNYSKNNMRNLIVDVSRGGKHFLVGVTLNYKADNIEINSVSGLFPKENHEWIKWIQDGKVLRIDQKEKVQDLINSLRTNPAESERIGLNLDDVAKKVKDFENPKLFGEEIIDDGKKGSDSTDRSVRENPKNEDKPRYSRKPGESIFDYASRVSEDVDRSVRERVSARDEYEKKVKSKGFQTKEALQNSMLGLQEFMSAIDHASGNKRYIEDIPDFENPILGENRLSSVNKEEMHQVAKTQFKPLMSAVAKLSGNGKESGELYDYMFAKHGLERDAVMRQREAQKEFDKYQKANPKGTKTIGDFVASLEGKDYAGLTALTAEDGRVKSIQSQIDAIDEQMKATDDQLLLRKLGGQKKRLKVDLLNSARDAADDIRKAFESDPNHNLSDINELWSRVNEVNGNTLRKLYESGMLTKEAYNDISSMYTNYIPMRGFDQTTSADAYAYLTHGDSAFNAPIKTAKGRSSKADNPIAYMQAMAESAIMQGNRNVLVKQKMLNFVRNHPSDLASVSDVWLQYDSVADEWKPFYAFGRELKGGVKRQERSDIFVEYQRCKMHGTYSFWGNQPNSSDLIPRAIIIGKATI